MQTLIHYYFAIGPYVVASPLFIPIIPGLIAQRMSKYKWIVHIATFAALLSTYVLYVRIGEILEPTSIGNPGNGLGLLLYLYFLVPAIRLYSLYAWLTRTGSQAARQLS
jgi:hypothetical protein